MLTLNIFNDMANDEQVFLHRESQTILIVMGAAADRRSIQVKVYDYRKQPSPVLVRNAAAQVVSIDGSVDVYLSSEQRAQPPLLMEHCQPLGSMWDVTALQPLHPADDYSTYERICDLAAKIAFYTLDNRQEAALNYWQLVEIKNGERLYESELFFTLSEALQAVGHCPVNKENELKLIKFPRVAKPTPPPVLTAKPVQPSPALKKALGQAEQPPQQSAANEHRLKPGKL